MRTMSARAVHEREPFAQGFRTRQRTIVGVGEGLDMVNSRRLGSEREGCEAQLSEDRSISFGGFSDRRRRRVRTESRNAGVETCST